MTRDLKTMKQHIEVIVCHQDKSMRRRQESEGRFTLRVLVWPLALLALVSWLPPPAEGIRLQPEGNQKVYWSGEQFVITCQNNHNIKNVKMRWIGPNGLDITEDKSKRVHAASSGPHGHRLVVMNATAPTDEGHYKCTLGSTDDRKPREETEFHLKLYHSTSFKDTARHLVLPAGQSGTLTCRVEFDPKVVSPSVSWVRDQKPFEMFNDSAYTVYDYDPTRQLSKLTISPLTKENDGVYTCRAAAVTDQLSKISDHDIQLETTYAPVFDQDSQTIWVERSQSVQARQLHQHHQQQQQLHQQSGNLYGPPQTWPTHAHQASRGRHRPLATGRRPDEEESARLEAGAPGAQVVRVELRCSCLSNPPASILWHSMQSSMYVMAKGEPEHVLEEPKSQVEGHNSTSVLVIGYNLDPEWTHRRDSYVCSASNKLGKASKSFTIEQGDPPPAFSVDPVRNYSLQTSLFRFTLLGPNFDPETEQLGSAAVAQVSQQEIVPPVDSFRIRAESTVAGEPKPGSQASYWSMQRQNEPNIQWSLANLPAGQKSNLYNQNFTINLGKLPSGTHKLFLEAHNAVGWSPNATYLGEYYIVSGASSLLALSRLSIVANLVLVWALMVNSRWLNCPSLGPIES